MGKGDTPSPPSYSQGSDGNDMEMMMAMMQMMSSQQQPMEYPEMPEMPALPEVLRTAEVDWGKKQESLASSMKAESEIDKARRKGRLDTIHTSPLLEDTDATTTASLLG